MTLFWLLFAGVLVYIVFSVLEITVRRKRHDDIVDFERET